MNRNSLSRNLSVLLSVVLIVGVTLYALRPHHTRTTAGVLPIQSTRIPLAATPATAPSAPSSAAPTAAPPVMSMTPALPAVATTPQPSQLPPPQVLAPPMLAAETSASTTQPQLAAWSPTPAAVPPAPPSDFLTQAASRSSAGDVLSARKMLNDALLSNALAPADLAATKKQIADLNDTIIFGPRKFSADEFGGSYLVKPGDRLKKIAESFDVPWQFLARINGLADASKMRSGVALKVIKGPFNVVVTKHSFTMDIYLGSTPGRPGSLFVRSYSVGLGRDDSTPTGTWMVGTKAKDPVYYSPRGEGVIPADDPKNPLGHRWISLIGMDGKAVGQQSYGIHGTIDPDSIGKQASMGCIRMHNEDVETVYDMLASGKSLVIVKD
jgi:LysM repeat protein